MDDRPPKAYEGFVERFPQLGQAWDLMREGGREAGALEGQTVALVKLGIAIGSQREGATHSAVRKARAAGVGHAEIEQVVALAASTIGLPPSVAAYTWVQDVLRPKE